MVFTKQEGYEKDKVVVNVVIFTTEMWWQAENTAGSYVYSTVLEKMY